jgi:hypothetical protein
LGFRWYFFGFELLFGKTSGPVVTRTVVSGASPPPQLASGPTMKMSDKVKSGRSLWRMVLTNISYLFISIRTLPEMISVAVHEYQLSKSSIVTPEFKMRNEECGM